MKRFGLIILLLGIGLMAHAQWGISANLSYGTKGYQHTQGGLASFDNTLPKGHEFNFSPRLGFSINGAVELGIDLGIGNSNYTYSNGIYNPNNETYFESPKTTYSLFTYSAGGYLRVRVGDWGKLTLHLEASAGYRYGLGVITNVEQRAHPSYGSSETITTVKALVINQMYATITPVFNYSLGKHASLDAYLNFASLMFDRTHSCNYSDYYSNRGIEDKYLESETTTHEFNIGLQALTTSLISLGFSYIF